MVGQCTKSTGGLCNKGRECLHSAVPEFGWMTEYSLNASVLSHPAPWQGAKRLPTPADRAAAKARVDEILRLQSVQVTKAGGWAKGQRRYVERNRGMPVEMREYYTDGMAVLAPRIYE